MKVLIDIDEVLYNYILDGTLNEVNHAVKNGVVLDKATNGQVIKAMFPNIESTGHCIETEHDVIRHYLIGEEILKFSDSWWNSPYKAESEVRNADSN